MQVLNMIFYTAITLGVLIFIHELGHFLAAKLTGMRVDRFSIGFPPRAFGKKFGDTDYCISWVPLGGYVKIAGMIDESFDTEFVNRVPEPWEFRAKPMWARMLVISAGVIMNILLAITIFWFISYSNGKVIKETTEVGFILSETPAARAGFQPGDRILAINGIPVTHWEEIENSIYIENFGSSIAFDVERNGRRITLTAPAQELKDLTEKPFGIVEAYTVPTIKAVESGMPAEKLGLKAGDIITAINQSPASYPQVVSAIKQHAGAPIVIQWKSEGSLRTGTTTVTKEGRIGISIEGIYTGPIKRIQYSLLGALPQGIKRSGESVYLFYLTISKIIAGQASIRESFGGPIAIAQLATQSAGLGLTSFLGFMALLSMSLAILNILPIPALDGGHLLMLFLEKIFRREIPYKVKLVIQQAGFILLLAFMAFVIYNDISRF